MSAIESSRQPGSLSLWSYPVVAIALALAIIADQSDSAWLYRLCLFVPSVLLLSLRLKCGQWITPFSTFIFLTCLFHFGQVWMRLLGLAIPPIEGYSDVFAMFPRPGLDQALVFSLIMTCLLTLGGLISGGPPRKVFGMGELHTSQSSTDSRPVWFLFTLVTGALVIAGDLARAANVSQFGYGEGFRYDSSLFYTANFVFPLGVIGVLLTNRSDSRVARALLAMVLIRNAFVILIVNNRGQAVAETLIYFLLWHHLSGRRWNRALVAMVVVAFVSILPFVSATRTGASDVSVAHFILSLDSFSLFLTEFGGTLATLAYAVQFVDLSGSATPMYLLSDIVSAIPFASYFAPDLNEFSSIGTILNESFNIAGLGGSLLAGIYMNFGPAPLSAVASIILGVVLSFASRYSLSTFRTPRLYTVALSWYFMLAAIMSVRGYLSDIFSSVKVGVFVLLVIWTLSRVFGQLTARPLRKAFNASGSPQS